MKQLDKFLGIFALLMVLAAGLGCSKLSESNPGPPNNTTTSNSSTTSSTNSKPDDSTKTAPSSKADKADFTMTSEELDRDFTKKGVTSKDLEKYSNKTIAVSGRVSLLETEKHGTTEPWVTLAAPGLGHGVSCYFDDDNVSQMKMLKMDKQVKVQGYQDDFLVPEVSPMLKHCVVLEGAN